MLAVFFLSDRKIENRIIYINTVFKGQTLERLFWPLVKAIFISVLAPVIMWGLDFVLNKINFKRQELRNKKNEQTWIAKRDIAKYEFEYEQAKTGKREIEDWEIRLRDIQELHRAELAVYEENKVTMMRTIEEERNIKSNEIYRLDAIRIDLESKISNSISLYGYSSQNTEIDFQKSRLIEVAGSEFPSITIHEIRIKLVDALRNIIESNYSDFQYVKFSRLINDKLCDHLIKQNLIHINNENGISLVKLTPLGLIIYQILFQELKL